MLVSGARADGLERFSLRVSRMDFVVFAEVDDGIHVCDGGFAGPDVEFIGAGEADAVEDGEEMQFIDVGLGFAEPPIG